MTVQSPCVLHLTDEAVHGLRHVVNVKSGSVER